MKRNLIACILIIYTNLLFSQVTTFDYNSLNLNNPDCNIFEPSILINSIPHSSRAGGVNLLTNEGLALSTVPNLSPQRGTAFVIGYIFSIGSKYSISIRAKGKPLLILGACVVPDLNQFATNGSTACSPDPNVSGYTPQGIGRLEVPTTIDFAAEAFINKPMQFKLK